MTKIFFLKMGKEVFGWGIIPAVAAARHGQRDVILSRQDLIGVRSVLRPLVTVQDQSIRDLFVFLSLLNGLRNQGNIIAPMQNMPHDKTIEEILDDGQKSPAVLQADVGNVSDPFLVGSLGHKVPLQNIVVAVVDVQLFHFAVGIGLAGDRANA